MMSGLASSQSCYTAMGKRLPVYQWLFPFKLQSEGVLPPKARLSLESQSFETTFADVQSCEAYEQDFEYSPDLLEATLISRDCRENVAQQEDLSNQLEKGDPGITSGDLCTRIEALLIVKNPQPGALATGFSHTPLYPPLGDCLVLM